MEKRRSLRRQPDYPAGLLGSARSPVGSVRLVDLSERGAAIETEREFQVGDSMAFEMSLDEGRPVSALATVRWARPAGYSFNYGLELRDLGFFDRSRLLKRLNPFHFGILEFADLLLEAAAVLTALFVAFDWISADPFRVQAALFILPWLLLAVFLTVVFRR